MSMLQVTVLAIFFAGWLFAHSRGGPPERIAATIILVWIAIDTAYHMLFGSSGFDRVDPVHLVFDGAQLAAMTWVALRANRMWPLWAAAAALMCFSAHLAVLVQPEGMRRAYWALMQLPQYIQLAALLLGVAAHAKRVERLGGSYRSWRKPAPPRLAKVIENDAAFALPTFGSR